MLYTMFFFFQEEDGIRDYKVTGVQTCALPISAARARHRHHGARLLRSGAEAGNGLRLRASERARLAGGRLLGPGRSVERRVGKAIRSGAIATQTVKDRNDEHTTMELSYNKTGI